MKSDGELSRLAGIIFRASRDPTLRPEGLRAGTRNRDAERLANPAATPFRSRARKQVARRQDVAFADWLAELRNLAGEQWPAVADNSLTLYAVWGSGATPAQALHMVGLILPPKVA